MSIVAKRLDGSRWHLALSGPWSRPHCARWGPSFPPQDVGESPQFSADFYCGQAAGCIKMPLGTEVGLGAEDIVLDGDSASPPEKGGGAPYPIFCQCLLWPNGWMDQDGTWHGGGLYGPRDTVLWWGPSSPPQKVGRTLNFRSIFIVAKRLDASRCHLVWR